MLDGRGGGRPGSSDQDPATCDLVGLDTLWSRDVSRIRVTGKGLLALAKAKRLQTLRVAGCPDVSAEDVAAARAAMPAVTFRTE